MFTSRYNTTVDPSTDTLRMGSVLLCFVGTLSSSWLRPTMTLALRDRWKWVRQARPITSTTTEAIPGMTLCSSGRWKRLPRWSWQCSWRWQCWLSYLGHTEKWPLWQTGRRSGSTSFLSLEITQSTTFTISLMMCHHAPKKLLVPCLRISCLENLQHISLSYEFMPSAPVFSFCSQTASELEDTGSP